MAKVLPMVSYGREEYPPPSTSLPPLPPPQYGDVYPPPPSHDPVYPPPPGEVNAHCKWYDILLN